VNECKPLATGTTTAVGADSVSTELGQVSSPLSLLAKAVAGAFSAAKSVISDFAATGVCGQYNELTVDARDADGRAVQVDPIKPESKPRLVSALETKT